MPTIRWADARGDAWLDAFSPAAVRIGVKGFLSIAIAKSLAAALARELAPSARRHVFIDFERLSAYERGARFALTRVLEDVAVHVLFSDRVAGGARELAYRILSRDVELLRDRPSFERALGRR